VPEISVDKAYERIHKFIQDCDGDSLAAVFEYVFADVEDAIYEDDTGLIRYDEPSESGPEVEAWYRIEYKCPDCGHEWEDEWSCAVDADTCDNPDCDAKYITAANWELIGHTIDGDFMELGGDFDPTVGDVSMHYMDCPCHLKRVNDDGYCLICGWKQMEE
jgi:hypothetical protein